MFAPLYTLPSPPPPSALCAKIAACKLPPVSSDIRYVSVHLADPHVSVSNSRGDSALRAFSSRHRHVNCTYSPASASTGHSRSSCVARARHSASESGGSGISPSNASARTCGTSRASHHSSSSATVGSAPFAVVAASARFFASRAWRSSGSVASGAARAIGAMRESLSSSAAAPRLAFFFLPVVVVVRRLGDGGETAVKVRLEHRRRAVRELGRAPELTDSPDQRSPRVQKHPETFFHGAALVFPRSAPAAMSASVSSPSIPSAF